MMPHARTLPLLLALFGCARSAGPPRVLPPPSIASVDASVATDASADAATAPTSASTPLRDVVSVALAPDNGGCAVQRDGRVWCWGGDAPMWAPVGSVSSDDVAPEGATPLPGVHEATSVCLFSGAVCVLRRDRSVLCRTNLSTYHEDTGDTTDEVIASAPPALRDTEALLPAPFGCVAVDRAGQTHFINLPTASARDLRVVPAPLPPIRCTLTPEATRCVGTNAQALLANDTVAGFTARAPSSLFGLTGLRDVAWGTYHGCAALGDGTVRCWGRNLDGQLGLADLRSRALPTAVPGLDAVVSLAALNQTTCAVRLDGTVWCWGSNDHGVLGVDGPPTHTTPRPLAGVEDVASLTLRDNTACALRRDGQVWCWGTGAPRAAGTPDRQPRPILRAPEAATPTPSG